MREEARTCSWRSSLVPGPDADGPRLGHPDGAVGTSVFSPICVRSRAPARGSDPLGPDFHGPTRAGGLGPAVSATSPLLAAQASCLRVGVYPWPGCAPSPPTRRAGRDGAPARVSSTSTRAATASMPRRSSGSAASRPTRLEGRVDLPSPLRPHPGRGHRRRRPPPVPLPPRLAGQARPAKFDRVAEAAENSPGPAPRDRAPRLDGMPLERASGWPSACSTSATSGSAAMPTPTPTAPFGLPPSRSSTCVPEGARLVFAFVNRSGHRAHRRDRRRRRPRRPRPDAPTTGR